MRKPVISLSGDNLFIRSSIQNLTADSVFVKACAVDDFDLGFSMTSGGNHQNSGTATSGHTNEFQTTEVESNPFNWDLRSLAMDNNKEQSENTYKFKEAQEQRQVSTVPSTHPMNNAIFSEDEEDVSEDEDMVVSPLDDELNLSYIKSFNPEMVVIAAAAAAAATAVSETTPLQIMDIGLNPLNKIPIPTSNINTLEIEERETSNRKRVKKVSSEVISRTNSPSPPISKSSTIALSPQQSQSQESQLTPTTSVASSGEKLFTCKVCETQFSVKGYLTRHMKKHAMNKPFMCPFYDIGSSSKCHPTGGFSRRDTFKTHLKALHFVYPTGTRCGERVDKRGRCAGCFEGFESNLTWLNDHVAANKCKGMISSYK